MPPQGVSCVGPVKYIGQAEVQRDIEYLKAGLQGAHVEEGFLSALAPGTIEQANPRHEHEWQVFDDVKLPDGKILMPGVLGHCAPEFVEQPELVAQRLIRYANLIGKENVIAGTDCGLSRAAHPSIMWAKFRAATEGARIATRKSLGGDKRLPSDCAGWGRCISEGLQIRRVSVI